MSNYISHKQRLVEKLHARRCRRRKRMAEKKAERAHKRTMALLSKDPNFWDLSWPHLWDE